MKASSAIALAAAMLLWLAAAARGDVDVQVNIGAPPPPPIVFQSAPPVTIIPGTPVYRVPSAEYPVYRVENRWYVENGGYWYRARTYRGPFQPIVVSAVPRVLLDLPEHHHGNPHGGPPGQLKKHGWHEHHGKHDHDDD
jgi:hypothetical protein